MFDRKTKKDPTPVQDLANKHRVMGGPRESLVESVVAPEAGVVSARSSKSETTTLGSNITVEGDLTFKGTLIVNCTVNGAITSGERLVVGADGKVSSIQAEVIEISGKVRGDIKAGKSVKILTGGEVDGDIETPTISMQEGVVFQGRCSRPAEAPSSPVTPPQAEVVEPVRQPMITARPTGES